MEAAEALRSDSKYLEPLFGSDLIDWIIESEINEHRAVESRPAPHEFYLYFDL